MKTATRRSVVAVLASLVTFLPSNIAAANQEVPDTEPPTRPLNLTLTAKTATSITLSWTASFDNVGVTYYEVWLDGDLETSPTNSFRVIGLTPNQSYTFRVRARDAAGNVSELSNALLATPEPGVNEVQPAVVRTQFHAVVLNYNPEILVDGSYVRLDDYYEHRDVDTLLQQYIELLRKASGGQTVWTVRSRFELNEFPRPEDHSKPTFTADNYLELRSQGYGYWSPDYEDIIHDARFGIADGINAGQIDAIWVFPPPATGFWETAMAGPTAYWVNGGPIIDGSLARNVVVYGFGKERHQGVGFMCENTSHMTENILGNHIAPSWPRTVSSRVFSTLNLDNPARDLVTKAINDWTHFTQAEAASWDPGLVSPENSQAGLSHFPPTAMRNYNWGTWSYDFNSPSPFRVYDGTWSMENGEYHVLPGDGVKVVAFDGITMNDNLGQYHPPIAFSDADVELTVRVLNGAKSSHAGFLFRVGQCAAGANQVKGYYVGISADEDRVIVAKLDNAYTELASAPYVIESNVTYRLRIEPRNGYRGGFINVYVDGSLTPLISTRDPGPGVRYSSGGFGLATYSTEAYFGHLSVVAHASMNRADQWYTYPTNTPFTRDISPLEWNGDWDVSMDNFYAWWWEHLPKNGGGHQATDVENHSSVLLLNTWWPYIFDINRFTSTSPFKDIVFAPEDVTPPEAPASAQGVALGASRIGLSWDEANDNVGVTRYAVYRDGGLVRKTALPFLTDERLPSPNSSYTYVIKSCDGSGNVSTTGAVVRVTTLQTDPQGVVFDGGFEVKPQACGWFSGAFNSTKAQFVWEVPGVGRNGTRCVSIQATILNDANWTQTVTGLTPGATYWLTGWIKGENVIRQPGRNIGANLCLVGTWEHAPDFLDGTFDWQEVSLQFTAPQSGSVTVGCRLGYWSNTAQGKVWFDDIAIVRPTELRLDQPRFLPGGVAQFLLTAWPGGRYRIEKSFGLETWTEVQTLTAVHPLTEISDTNFPVPPALFYRAMQLPSAVSP